MHGVELGRDGGDRDFPLAHSFFLLALGMPVMTHDSDAGDELFEKLGRGSFEKGLLGGGFIIGGEIGNHIYCLDFLAVFLLPSILFSFRFPIGLRVVHLNVGWLGCAYSE